MMVQAAAGSGLRIFDLPLLDVSGLWLKMGALRTASGAGLEKIGGRRNILDWKSFEM
jgi:hypothetical protein